jgi:hypothetical protein
VLFKYYKLTLTTPEPCHRVNLHELKYSKWKRRGLAICRQHIERVAGMQVAILLPPLESIKEDDSAFYHRELGLIKRIFRQGRYRISAATRFILAAFNQHTVRIAMGWLVIPLMNLLFYFSLRRDVYNIFLREQKTQVLEALHQEFSVRKHTCAPGRSYSHRYWRTVAEVAFQEFPGYSSSL